MMIMQHEIVIHVIKAATNKVRFRIHNDYVLVECVKIYNILLDLKKKLDIRL